MPQIIKEDGMAGPYSVPEKIKASLGKPARSWSDEESDRVARWLLGIHAVGSSPGSKDEESDRVARWPLGAPGVLPIAAIGYLGKYLGKAQSHDVKDVVQDAMLKIYKCYDPGKGHIIGFAHIIVKRICLAKKGQTQKIPYSEVDAIRGDRRNIEFDPANPSANPEEAYRKKEYRAWLVRLISAVDEKFPGFSDKYLGVMSIRKIAEKLSTSEAAVKTRLLRGRELLKHLIKKEKKLYE